MNHGGRYKRIFIFTFRKDGNAGNGQKVPFAEQGSIVGFTDSKCNFGEPHQIRPLSVSDHLMDINEIQVIYSLDSSIMY